MSKTCFDCLDEIVFFFALLMEPSLDARFVHQPVCVGFRNCPPLSLPIPSSKLLCTWFCEMNLILYAACLLSGFAYAKLKSMIQDPVFPQVHRFCFSAFQNGLRFPRRFYFLAAIGSDLHNHLKSLSHLFSSSQLVLNKNILASILHATVRWV